MVDCLNCVVYGNCSYEPHSEDCQARRQCVFCVDHSKGSVLYELGDYVNSFRFDPIGAIEYCPLCGKELED